MKKLFLVFSICASLSAYAGQKKDWGRVSASLESLNHIYADDALNNFYPLSGEDPELTYLNGRYASNNYLKVDYYKGRFAAGMQVEGYFPSTIGYPIAQNKLSVSNLYFNWTDDAYSVTAGTFYDQLGSGLLFRSWEDRTLGLNNAILGAKATWSFKEVLSVKVFGGIPRLGKISPFAYNTGGLRTEFFGLGLSETAIAAADMSVSISDILKWNTMILSLEGSVLYKHENIPEKYLKRGCLENNVGWSGRLNIEAAGFYMRGEYVDAGLQITDDPDLSAEHGNAQLLELGYNQGGLGLSVTGRRLRFMTQQIFTEKASPMYATAANVMSYCPAMCTQYTYMLTTLIPYEPITALGEAGGQIDAFYNFRRGTLLGGKRGMRVHANFSTYYPLGLDGSLKDSEYAFRDFSFDVEKQFTKKFKAVLLYSLQDHNGMKKNDDGMYVEAGMSHTVVADLLYKWTSHFSTRLELQYLAAKGYQKDWMAGLLEVSFAPHWSIFASDMYNHGSSGKHYYNAGLSYAMQWLRIAAGYGRYRAGYICSGGVCRAIPAYTGANITLTATF